MRPSTILRTVARIGDDTPDGLDLAAEAFDEPVELLASQRMVSLDEVLDDLDAGATASSFVLTFDDGFPGVYEHAWPRLRAAGLPFTIYVASAYIGGVMTWKHLEELAASPLTTIANHTHTCARPEQLSAEELGRCSEVLEPDFDT